MLFLTLHSILILSALSSLPDPPIKSEGKLNRGIGGHAWSGNPWFDKLAMTIVTLSLSKGGFSGQTGGGEW